MNDDIRAVDASRAAEAVQLLKGAAQWLIDRGIGHWSLEEFRAEDFEAAAGAGELIMGFEERDIAAVMLLQSADRLYWPLAPVGSALYVHKLAVRRASAGRRWSARMIEWAAAVARERAIPRLRMDTMPGSVLQSLYESYGFIAIDQTPVRLEAVSVIRMERML